MLLVHGLNLSNGYTLDTTSGICMLSIRLSHKLICRENLLIHITWNGRLQVYNFKSRYFVPNIVSLATALPFKPHLYQEKVYSEVYAVQ